MTLIRVQDVYNAVDKLAPFSLAQSWDNVGLLLGSPSKEVRRLMLALDATLPVVVEAAAFGADLIVTHHPVIFRPVGRIGGDTPVYRLIRHDIPVISAHTNLDIAQGGVNDALAEVLGLENLEPLDVVDAQPWYKVAVFVPQGDVEKVYAAMVQAGGGTLGNYAGCAFFTPGQGRFLPGQGANPAIGTVGVSEQVEEHRIEMAVPPDKLSALLSAMTQAHPYEEVAYDVYSNHGLKTSHSLGRVGTLKAPMLPDVFAAHVKQALGGGLKYVAGNGEITRVAVCGGGGAGYLELAKKLGAQALVTGESKHNQLLDAGRMGMTFVDAGHYLTERVVLEPLMKRLQDTFPQLELQIARSDGDGVRYL